MAAHIVEIKDEQEWLNYRGTGLGASEIGTLLGYNPNKSSFELWHDKVGFRPRPFINNRMLYGKATEDLTSHLWMAYNGDKETQALNHTKKRYFRKCIKLPEWAFIRNDDFPHLFVSPDRGILASNAPEDITADMNLNDWIIGSLEIKDTSSMYINAYHDKISPMHIIQLKTQVMAWGKDMGMLAYVIDGGRDYAEHTFVRDGIIFHDKYSGETITEENLKERVYDFWESVVLGREASHNMAQAKLNFQMDKVAAYQDIIYQLEPKPDTSLAFENFVKEGWYAISKPLREIQGTQEHIDMANGYLSSKDRLDHAKDDFQLHRNTIFNVCKAGERIKLPASGCIEVKQNKTGVSIKVKV